jgi:uncharacterized RDD family membrane protein YckC
MSTPPALSPAATPVESLPAPEPRYVGLVTRAIAIVVDAALISLVTFIVAGGVALILALIHHPRRLEILVAAIGAAASVLWTVGYFVTFWASTGQTPGMRLMQIRVLTARGDRVTPSRGVVRCVGLVLAALPLFAGFVPVLFDSRRRGLQDHLARTVVVEAPQLSLAEALQAGKRVGDDPSLGEPRAPGA